MNYIIMDMEWNQAQSPAHVVQSPVVLHGEIIQIGAVKTDEQFNFIEKIKIAVCPKYYKKMNRHVEKITGITSLQLTYGERFPQAFKRLVKWCGNDFRFITWGSDDIGMLAENLSLHGLDPNFGGDYINLQLIYKRQVDPKHLQCALAAAAESLDVPMNIQAHDALNDALYTYEICRRLDMQKGLAEYSELAGVTRVALRKDVIKNVTDNRAVLDDSRVRNCQCPSCDLIMTPNEWVYYGGGKKTTVTQCSEHGDFLVKLTCKKVSDGNWTVNRSVYAADKDTIKLFNQKLEEQNRKRLERAAEREMELKNGNNGND
jgi:inhibitor of KinA sporulation pathway (predicted exonuclease)